MKTELRYYTRRVVGFLLVGAVAFLIRSCSVNAAGCTGTWYIGYINPSNNTWNTASTLARELPNNTTHIAYALRTTINANLQLTYNSKIGMRLYNYGANTTITPQIRYAYSGGYVDITGACSYTLNKRNVSSPDDLIRYEYEYTISCYYANTPQTGTGIEVHFDLPYPVYTTSTHSSTMYANNSASCLALSPSDSQLIINNNNQNSINIENAINQNGQQQHQDLQDINNTMNNSNVDTNNASNTIGGISNSMPSSNVLGNLITMPVMLVQKIINALNTNTCTPYTLGQLFGTNFTLPCVDLSSILGAVWTILDAVVSGFIAYEIGKHFVLIFHKLTSFDSTTLEEVYR